MEYEMVDMIRMTWMIESNTLDGLETQNNSNDSIFHQYQGIDITSNVNA